MSTNTKFLSIVIQNPSKKRGYYVKYAYKVYSSSKPNPIVLISGWSGCKETWTMNFIQDLAKNRMVIVTDHRGIGESKIIFDPNNMNQSLNASTIPLFTLSDLGNDIVTLINHIGITKVDILGHSMGISFYHYIYCIYHV